MSTAVETSLVRIEVSLTEAVRIYNLAIAADDALNRLGAAAGEEAVSVALSEVRGVQRKQWAEIERLKAEQRAVRGW